MLNTEMRNVVLVHGLWLGKTCMRPLARRLRRAGYATKIFGYSTTRSDLDVQVDDLYRFAVFEDGQLPHFVAHSMGGLLTLQLMHTHPDTPSGRIVLLGSPLRGSEMARRVSQWRTGPAMLGKAESTLVQGVRAWPEQRDVGMIAGSRQFGFGVFAGGGKRSGDGTVYAEESTHEGLDDHIEIATTHMGLLISREVTRQTLFFLRHGRFSR